MEVFSRPERVVALGAGVMQSDGGGAACLVLFSRDENRLLIWELLVWKADVQ